MNLNDTLGELEERLNTNEIRFIKKNVITFKTFYSMGFLSFEPEGTWGATTFHQELPSSQASSWLTFEA